MHRAERWAEICGGQQAVFCELPEARHPRIDAANPKFRSYLDLRPPILSYSRVVRYTPITISQEELILHYNVHNDALCMDTRGIEDLFDSYHYPNLYRDRLSGMPPFRIKFVDNLHEKVELLILVSVGIGMLGSSAEGFRVTLRAVMENLANLEESGRVRWDQALLCVVVNGRAAFEEFEKESPTSVLGELERMGIYFKPEELWEHGGEMERAGRITTEDRQACRGGRYTADGGYPVHVHLYEGTIMMQGGRFPPVRLALCVKECPDKGLAGSLATSRLSCHLWGIVGIAQHITNMSSSTRSNSQGEPDGSLRIIAMDCGMCPAPDCLSVMVTRLSRPKVGIVSADTWATAPYQLLDYPTVWDMLLHPFLCAWLVRQRLRAVADAAMETGLGGFLSTMEGSLCGFRLGVIDVERYFAILTRAGNSPMMAPLTPNFYLCDGGAMLGSVHRGWRCELLPNAKVVCHPTQRQTMSKLARDFSYKDLMDSSRVDVLTIFQALRRLLIAWNNMRCDCYLPFRVALLLYRFVDVGLSSLSLLIMNLVMLIGSELLYSSGQVPVAYILLVLSVVMFQLCVGVGGLTPQVLVVFQASSLVFGVLWTVGIVKLIIALVSTSANLFVGAFIAHICSYLWSIVLYGDLRFVLKVLPVCAIQWLLLYPTTTVLGSSIYCICMSGVLPWGTPGPSTVDPRTSDTLAKRMEVRSWLAALWGIANLLPIVFSLTWAGVGTASDEGSTSGDGGSNVFTLRVSFLAQAVAWVVLLDTVLRTLTRIIGTTLFALKRICETLGSRRNRVPRWVAEISTAMTAASSPSNSIPSLMRGPYSFYETEKGMILITIHGTVITQPLNRSILGIIGGRRAAEITATVGGAAIPSSSKEAFAYSESEDSVDDIERHDAVFVPCPRKKSASSSSFRDDVFSE
ncbi:Chitin synthase, class 2 [Perkinsus chesapeaki]|uniref:Chitin synthase, class 2 n=1 Tax=Perkinsus chesapeaki TaxID=330153 RepID=A0A7J6N1Y4_PERCH|nr:Chitin synthase, class 2 [Perkinsus chesapeaki]